jgi:hypothetical protein
MDLRAVRRRCESTLRSVSVPSPFDIRVFAATVSARRGRSIYLLPKSASVGPCGVWLAMPSADYVFFENATSPLHREHIILHELGHLLRDHAPTEVIDDRALRLLLPTLDLDVIRRVIGRTSYSAVEEQEAEMIASLVLDRVEFRTAPRDVVSDSEVAVVIGRLESTLGSPGQQRG